MGQHDGKRRPGQGAQRDRNEASRDRSIGYAVVADLKHPAPKKPRVVKTIEDRLVEKADAADRRDYSGQRSLGQMSREELRKHLFGDE
jgi:hypothetical protein